MADFQEHAFKSDAERHAKEQTPLEACGLIVLHDDLYMYWPCRNLCENPEQHFIMDPRDYLKASLNGAIVGIVHSHPNGQEPSGLDRKACMQSGLPWWIYQMPQDQWLIIKP